MDRGEVKENITSFFGKYRWASVVFLVGLFLMALPDSKPEEPAEIQDDTKQISSLQQELEDILARMEGAGKVKVLLTPASGAETYYQTDADVNTTSDSGDRHTETVIITSSDRNENGLIQRIDPPVWLGAVVLCQGADSASVRFAVVDAVATATGLTSDKISVWKMK